MPEIRKTIRRIFCLVAAVGLVSIATPTSWALAEPVDPLPASPSGPAHQTYTSPQPASNADFTDRGANTHGPYDSTRSGAPSLNGSGDGAALGEPCAGCVGKADNKNPSGQLPDGSDPNAGYECDSNHGVGLTNPAHTGCLAGSSSGTSSPPVLTSSSPPAQPTSHGAESASAHRNTGTLASTGGFVRNAVNAAIFVIVLGTALVLFGRRSQLGTHVR
jgi:hypothetical protein